MEPRHSYYVVDVVPVEAIGRGEHDIVAFTVFQLAHGQDVRAGTLHVALRNKFVEVGGDGQDPSATLVFSREGDIGLAGKISDIPERRLGAKPGS